MAHRAQALRQIRARLLAWAGGMVLVAVACGPVPARDVGAQLFEDARLARSDANAFSCATCHATSDGDPRLLPGASLVGAAARPTYWGGYAPQLLDATNHCLTFFMRGPPLTSDEPRARALYEFLLSLEGGDSEAQPLTIVENITSVARADPGRGREVWDGACGSCHGDPHTGAGRLTEEATVVPEGSADFADDSGFPLDLVVTEKIRHGAFFGVGGTMPLFSAESLSDEDLGALLAFLEI